MSKKNIEKMHKEYSKPQLSRWQKQKKRQRLIMWSGIGLIALVVLGLVGVYIWQEVTPLYRTVISVNGQKITMNDYIKVLRATLQGQNEQELFYSAYYTGMDLVQASIIEQGAAALNISVSDEEVKTYLNDYGIDKGRTPIARAQLLVNKLMDEYFKPQVPVTAEQRNINAMFLESEAQVSEIRAEIEAGASFADLAAEYSLDSYTQSKNGSVGMHPQEIFTYLLGTTIPGDYAFASEPGSLSQPRPDTEKEKTVGYWLIKVIEKGTGDNEGQINVRVMLLGSEEEALSIREELTQIADPEQLNEEFSNLADEISQYDSGGKNGGLVGFIDESLFSDAFNEIAFNLEVGEISQPVKDTSQTTTGGAWLVNVIEVVNDAEVTADDINILANALFNLWYTMAESSAEIQSLTSEDVTFALEKIIGS